MGKAEQALEDIEGALRLFEEEYSLRDVARALGEMVWFYVKEDRVQDELAAGLRSVTLYEDMEDLRGQLWARSHLSWALRQPELYQEALDNAEKSVRIGEKIGDYNNMALTLWGSALIYDLRGDARAAVAESLKAAEYAERTNAYMTQRNCYGHLVRCYAKLGEIERAEEYFKKIEKVIDKAVSVRRVSFSKALLLTAKGQWKEANECFEELFEKKELSPWGSGPEMAHRGDYAWALAKQGRTEEAKTQLEISKKNA